MILGQLDPRFLAWLRAEGYVNGLGPRSWVIGGSKVVVPGWFHLPTPGLKGVFEQHDLDHLLGGGMRDCAMSDDRCLEGMSAVASRSWFLPAAGIRAAMPVVRALLDRYSWLHFRGRDGGPRTERELMRDLHYPDPYPSP